MQCIRGSDDSPPLVVTHKQCPKVGPQRTSSMDDGTCHADYAVYIRNLCKSYDGGAPIVRNLCMSVKKGSIYSLLGASGCGKTTVLSCIVGLRQWESGQVLVFGKQPGTKESGIPGRQLGYMPQDLALYANLSIHEIIRFYARLYSMTNTELKERWTFLHTLLELPATSKILCELSGGQARRVSLAVALIHSPELLVLDEPTVGLDPLLRINIWDHLYKIVATLGTTIIITTHYIEEARLSNTIGVMRKGRLLVEDSPQNLLFSYKCDLLEDVVMQLCRADESTLQILAKTPNSQEVGNHVVFNSSWNDISVVAGSVGVTNKQYELMHGVFRKNGDFDCNMSRHLGKKLSHHDEQATGFWSKLWGSDIYQSCERIHGLTEVMLTTFVRYPWFLLLILFIPTIQGSITLVILGSKMRNIHFGIVNNELLNWSEGCDFSKSLPNATCDLNYLSCRYINQLKNDSVLILDQYESEGQALSMVEQGKAWGYLSMPDNYSQHTVDLVTLRHYASNDSIDGSRVHIRLDFSQYIAAFFMVKHIFGSFVNFAQEVAAKCDIGKEAVVPLFYRPPVYGTNEDDYTLFILPGVIVCSVMGIVVALTALVFIADHKQGTLSRARVAGLRTEDVMASHLITQGIVTICQILIWTAVLYFLFDITILGNFFAYLMFCLIIGVCGAGMGLLIGICCRDEVEALVLGVFLIPIFLLYGGVIFPTESIPTFWRYLGSLLPVSVPTISLRSIIVRGLGWGHPTVWPGLCVLVAWIVVFSILIVFAYRKFLRNT